MSQQVEPAAEEKIDKSKPLSRKQRVFVEEYLKCWNASEAARRAGYKGKANVVGPRLLANVSIQAAIEARINELQMGADEVLVRLAEQARFDPLQFVTIDPEHTDKVYVDLAALKKAGLGAIVKKIAYDKFGNLVVEFHDSQAAQRLIGQHHRLFAMRNENLNLDYSQLTDEQLDRIAAGEDPWKVALSNSGRSGDRAT
jgi:phage terminase small subunit